MQRMRGWLDFSGGACECGWNYKKYAKNLAPDCAAVIRIKRQGLRQCLCHLSSSLHFPNTHSRFFRASPETFHETGTHTYVLLGNIIIITYLNFWSLMKTRHRRSSLPRSFSLSWKCGKTRRQPNRQTPGGAATESEKLSKLQKKEEKKGKQQKQATKKRKTASSPDWGATFFGVGSAENAERIFTPYTTKKKKEEYLES